MENQPGTMTNHKYPPTMIKKRNVTNAGSQLTWEGSRAGISKNVTDTKRDRRGVTTDLGGGQGRNKQKRYRHKT